MYYLNKMVWSCVNPIMITLVLMGVGFWLARRPGRRRTWGVSCWVGAFIWVWFSATPLGVALLGLPLEKPYRDQQSVESLPTADAIVVLGGGMCKANEMVYPDMADGADRVWHAARLYRAGKAPLIVASGVNETQATVPLLVDLGVPREAILVDDVSRNTYENSRFTEKLLKASGSSSQTKEPRILLVTSAWHMPRAQRNFARTSLKVVPAAADFKVSNLLSMHVDFYNWLSPSPEMAHVFSYLEKEWIGRLARR